MWDLICSPLPNSRHGCCRIFSYQQMQFNRIRYHKISAEIGRSFGVVKWLCFDHPEQAWRVIIRNPSISYINLKDTWNRVLGAFRKEEDIIKLVYNNSKILNFSEDMLKSAISLWIAYLGWWVIGSRGKAALFAHNSFGRKWIGRRFGAQEGICICFVCNIEGVGKENIGWKLRCLSSLSFSERQVSNLWRWQ